MRVGLVGSEMCIRDRSPHLPSVYSQTVTPSAICLLTNSHPIVCHLPTHKQSPHLPSVYSQTVTSSAICLLTNSHLICHLSTHKQSSHHLPSVYSQTVTPSSAISSPISCCFTGSFNTMQSVPLSPAVYRHSLVISSCGAFNGTLAGTYFVIQLLFLPPPPPTPHPHPPPTAAPIRQSHHVIMWPRKVSHLLVSNEIAPVFQSP